MLSQRSKHSRAAINFGLVCARNRRIVLRALDDAWLHRESLAQAWNHKSLKREYKSAMRWADEYKRVLTLLKKIAVIALIALTSTESVLAGAATSTESVGKTHQDFRQN